MIEKIIIFLCVKIKLMLMRKFLNFVFYVLLLIYLLQFFVQKKERKKKL